MGLGRPCRLGRAFLFAALFVSYIMATGCGAKGCQCGYRCLDRGDVKELLTLKDKQHYLYLFGTLLERCPRWPAFMKRTLGCLSGVPTDPEATDKRCRPTGKERTQLGQYLARICPGFRKRFGNADSLTFKPDRLRRCGRCAKWPV